MDDLTDVREMYNAAWGAESTRLQRHQLEADITWRYLDRYLPSIAPSRRHPAPWAPPGGRILNIGFGTGAYTFPLVKRGYRITAVDLAEEFVTRCKTMADEPDDAPRGGFRGYFVRPEEIAPMHEAVGFRILQIVGVEPAISADDESYNALDGKQRELWLNLLFEVSAERSMLASSRHLLYVGRRGDG